MRAHYTLHFPIVFALVAGYTSSDPPPAQVGAFYSGEYRSLFAELLRKSGEQIPAQLDGAWEHPVYGNDDTHPHTTPFGDQMTYIEDISHRDARSESISYGMMIAVQMDKVEEFDRLWT